MYRFFFSQFTAISEIIIITGSKSRVNLTVYIVANHRYMRVLPVPMIRVTSNINVN